MDLCVSLSEKRADLLPAEALISHIIWRYHDRHRRDLRDLIRLAQQADEAKVFTAIGPQQLCPALMVFANELEHHMNEEEELLFPLMLSGRALNLGAPINHILAEHRHHATMLNRFDELVGAWAALKHDPLVQELAARLETFVQDLRKHFDLEGNVLFPQFARGSV